MGKYSMMEKEMVFKRKYVLQNNNNNKRQFVRRRNMSVDITRAPHRQSGNVVRDSSTETRLFSGTV